MSEIQVTATPATDNEANEAVALMQRGAEFPTPNGEMPDSMARWLGNQLGFAHPLLRALGNGEPVDRDALSEAVGEVGRRSGWPCAQEYLATWVLNHD
jgi:hypothetical protein